MRPTARRVAIALATARTPREWMRIAVRQRQASPSPVHRTGASVRPQRCASSDLRHHPKARCGYRAGAMTSRVAIAWRFVPGSRASLRDVRPAETVAARRAPAPGVLPWRSSERAGVEGARPEGARVEAGAETGPGAGAPNAGADDGVLRSALPCSARLARVVSAFGGAFRSTGLVILSVILAMGEAVAACSGSASHHSGPAVFRRTRATTARRVQRILSGFGYRP